MAEFKVYLPCDVEADYGIGFASVLEVRGEHTPASTAPRSKYGWPEYEDVLASVDIASVTMVVGDARIDIPLADSYLGPLEDDVLAAVEREILQSQANAAELSGLQP